MFPFTFVGWKVFVKTEAIAYEIEVVHIKESMVFPSKCQ
jgi:hypothetical protein